jgi:hypothetical protein
LDLGLDLDLELSSLGCLLSKHRLQLLHLVQNGSDVATATADVANGARRAHSPGAVPDPRADPEWLDRIYALHELVPMAKAKLTKQDWEFMRGGADAEASIRRNRLELDSLVRPSNPPLLAIYGDVLFSFTPSRAFINITEAGTLSRRLQIKYVPHHWLLRCTDYLLFQLLRLAAEGLSSHLAKMLASCSALCSRCKLRQPRPCRCS